MGPPLLALAINASPNLASALPEAPSSGHCFPLPTCVHVAPGWSGLRCVSGSPFAVPHVSPAVLASSSHCSPGGEHGNRVGELLPRVRLQLAVGWGRRGVGGGAVLFSSGHQPLSRGGSEA